VTVKTSTRKNKNSVVYISQSVPGGILFETVSLNNELGRNIRTIAPRSMWPTVDRNQGEILDGVQKIVVRVGDLVQKEIG
jgi:pyruvate/2-oxoacid:ferredoxin oxidoreductase alpha subunit